MRNEPHLIKVGFLLLGILAMLSDASLVAAQTPLKFSLSPSTIPAGRTRTIKIKTASDADLTGFELIKPPEDSGVVFEDPGQLADGKTAILARVKVDEDADEQTLPLFIVKKDKGKVVETYTVDLTISAYSAKTLQRRPIPPGMTPEVDAMFQPMSYQSAKDVFGRRVANHYYAVAVNLGNNTGFDLQINKIGFVTTRTIQIPELDNDGNPVFEKGEEGKVKMRDDLLRITAIDRSLVRSSIERDQNFGVRALALNLIGGVGTLTTGFLPFFHALGPRANFSSFSSVLNGNLRDGFTTAVPDLTIRHLNRLDNNLVMDQDFVLPNNSERNTVVFVPRKALDLDKKSSAECRNQKDSTDCKDQRDDLLKVKETLGRLVIVGRPIEVFENRQIVVRSDRPSREPEPFSVEPVKQGPISITSVSPDAGTLSDSTDVVITGTGFMPGTPLKVMFGDRQTTGVALTSTTVQATVPPNAKATPIKVEVFAGAHKDKLDEGYTYVDELKIDSIDPATGPVAGKTVKIIGKGFLSGATVEFDGKEATEVMVANDHNSITAKVPAHPAGKIDVEVKNRNKKSAKKAAGFTYTE